MPRRKYSAAASRRWVLMAMRRRVLQLKGSPCPAYAQVKGIFLCLRNCISAASVSVLVASARFSDGTVSALRSRGLVTYQFGSLSRTRASVYSFSPYRTHTTL